MVYALRAVYGFAGLRYAVYISWFTASPVYASLFTFYGLRFAVYGCAGQFYITTIKLFM
jgi:hypothetical protein